MFYCNYYLINIEKGFDMKHAKIGLFAALARAFAIFPLALAASAADLSWRPDAEAPDQKWVIEDNPAMAVKYFNTALDLWKTHRTDEARGPGHGGLSGEDSAPPIRDQPFTGEIFDRIADALVLGARHSGSLRFGATSFGYANGAVSEAIGSRAWPSADLRPFVHFMAEASIHKASIGRHSEAMRLLLAINDFVRFSHHGAAITGKIANIALLNQIQKTIAALAPDMPAAMHHRLLAELWDRLHRCSENGDSAGPALAAMLENMGDSALLPHFNGLFNSEIMSLRLLAAGVAYLSNPDIHAWSSLPHALHPASGKPYIIAPDSDDGRANSFIVYEDAAARLLSHTDRSLPFGRANLTAFPFTPRLPDDLAELFP